MMLFSDPSGSGILFFDFIRIKQLVHKHNPGHFFWIYENVASMGEKNLDVVKE